MRLFYLKLKFRLLFMVLRVVEEIGYALGWLDNYKAEIGSVRNRYGTR